MRNGDDVMVRRCRSYYRNSDSFLRQYDTLSPSLSFFLNSTLKNFLLRNSPAQSKTYPLPTYQLVRFAFRRNPGAVRRGVARSNSIIIVFATSSVSSSSPFSSQRVGESPCRRIISAYCGTASCIEMLIRVIPRVYANVRAFGAFKINYLHIYVYSELLLEFSISPVCLTGEQYEALSQSGADD